MLLSRFLQHFITTILLVVAAFFSNYSNAEDIPIFIRDDVYEDYLHFVNGREVSAITNFSGTTIRRDVVDMIIAQQALELGGFRHTFQYTPGKLNFRNTQMIQKGKMLIGFDSFWLSDAKAIGEDVYISDAVIRNGEYVAGIYTSPTNNKVLAIDSLEDLTKLTSISTPKWSTDWKTLSSLPLKELVREDEWLSQARMVHLGWIDFILMAFHSTPDKSFSLAQIHLVPVPNIGVILKDSRHFVISRKHPLGKETITALNLGLAKLRQGNAIEKAYKEAGFFVDKNKVKIINE